MPQRLPVTLFWSMIQWRILRGVGGQVADQDDAAAVVADARVAADDDVAGRGQQDDAGKSAVGQLRGVAAVRLRAVVRRLVVDDDRLVRHAQPKAVAAVVGLVVPIDVPRRLALEAIVMGVRGVVVLEDVAGAHPAVQRRRNTPSPPCVMSLCEKTLSFDPLSISTQVESRAWVSPGLIRSP